MPPRRGHGHGRTNGTEALAQQSLLIAVKASSTARNNLLDAHVDKLVPARLYHYALATNSVRSQVNKAPTQPVARLGPSADTSPTPLPSLPPSLSR